MSSPALDTRSRILDAACRALGSGEAAPEIRMADIAKAAGVSRQALYLHFKNRADLLIATVRHVDIAADTDAVLAESRGATGPRRLSAWIAAWGGYIETVYPYAKALMAMYDDDPDAAAAWDDRMHAMREGCAAAVEALVRADRLTPDLTPDLATDLLFALLSIRMWEVLTKEQGWPIERYIAEMTKLAHARLVVAAAPV
ncbi:TetR/AcrR family transcriptional regulator [Pontivivens insulae]|uniref:HTH-type transcriptional regulator BetI n=1 Tax=Pontivivens insulae TaxID=1639689 RepID=A0A2R8AB24_9RHOB|nr:TetR/AcrR family transcriptional regulator [Pontivivens insulae]RED13158.1 TetR family transcriptional regulator [Pontivivens insulae]SPF29250.1 HTH-type transcriptional regulator BetI [Pontivivens insulae]